MQQSKTKKKSHMTFKNIFVQQLCMIHQSVSLKIAEKLVAEYGSWAGLLDAYNMVDIEKRPLMLKNIRVDERRKVGPAASKHVYEFCYSLTEKTEVVLEPGHAGHAGYSGYSGHEQEGICLI